MSQQDSAAVRAMRIAEGRATKEQVSSDTEHVLKPQAIYFDTNPLLGAGWPKVSPPLLQIMNEAEKLGVPLCLPDAVGQELEGHWIRELTKEWQEANGRVERCNLKAHTLVKFKKLPALPSQDELRKAVRGLTGDFTKRFRSVPLTQRPLSAFLKLAISRGATFEDEGRGFQDAVILCSILDDMKAAGFKVGFLVTSDKSFSSDGANQLVKEEGVTLRTVATLDRLEGLLRLHFELRDLERLKRDRQQLMDALNTRKQDLERYLIENLTVTASELGLWLNVRKVEALNVVSIENAYSTSSSFGEKESTDSNDVRISLDAKVRLTLDIAKSPVFEQPRFKIGGGTVPPTETEPSLFAAVLEMRERLREATVVVEANAVRTEAGYSDIRFTGAHLKGPSSPFDYFAKIGESLK